MLALGAHGDPGPAAGTWLARTAVDGSPSVPGKLAMDRATQVRHHRQMSGLEQFGKLLIVEFCKRRPRIDSTPPQRFASVDVPDAGGDALVQEHLAHGHRAQRACALHDRAHRPGGLKDVRA